MSSSANGHSSCQTPPPHRRKVRSPYAPFLTHSSSTSAPSSSTTSTSTSSPSSNNPNDISGHNNTTDGDDFLPSTTAYNRFLNFYRMLTSKMSPQGQVRYWSDADDRYSALDCRRCEAQRDYLLQYSPVIRYLSENIRRLGGDVGSHNVRCRTCKGPGMLGGFDYRYGVVVCANWVSKRSAVEDVMAHEMVHAWDTLRFKTELAEGEDLRKVACSEIRASNLSGECRWSNEFFKNKILAFTTHHQDCVRRRAIHSVKTRPNCKDDVQAVKVVNEVWDSCFPDTRPFDEIYR